MTGVQVEEGDQVVLLDKAGAYSWATSPGSFM